MAYQELYQKSIEQKEAFWKEETSKLNWFHHPEEILSDHGNGHADWFADGRINMSFICLDVHIANGRGDQNAIIYDSPLTDIVRYITYNELHQKVCAFAAGLYNLGLAKGDTAIIYMPMIPEAIVAMLACARLGVIHSVVFGGFAPHELAVRIDDAKPKVVISASYGIEFGRKIPYKVLVDQALAEARHQTHRQIYFRREKGYDDLSGPNEMDFEAFYTCGSIQPVQVESSHPLYILYTSGTTGRPKGIVRDTGGYATALRHTMEYFYHVKPGDVFWAASDIGWVVGHSYIVYAPLLYGCTTVLYEGKPVKTPDAGAFWRVLEQHKVNVLFTAPTAIRAIKKEDNTGALLGKYNISSLRQLFLAGERCDINTYEWISNLLQIPVIDHWWQTESGSPMLGMMTAIESRPPKPGSAGFSVSGFDIRILDEAGNEAGPNEEGNIVIRLPLPPGCLTGLWKSEARFQNGYFTAYPGYYLAGDSGFRDEEGYFFVMGRIDDVINVSGHRLSTGEMEEIVSSHKAVAECAVVGMADVLKGQVPLGLVVLKDDADVIEESLEEDLVQLVREQIGAIACLKTIIVVPRLPKTRSGKILRRIIAQIADRKTYALPSTIEDISVLEEIEYSIIRRLGAD
ncbi:MAG: acetate--CoA ligase [Taibaiella sp.]|nr:acetate--CoA ligase [Taibaiella sp.]